MQMIIEQGKMSVIILAINEEPMLIGINPGKTP